MLMGTHAEHCVMVQRQGEGVCCRDAFRRRQHLGLEAEGDPAGRGKGRRALQEQRPARPARAKAGLLEV